MQQAGDYADDKAAYRHETGNDNHANAPLSQRPCPPFGPSSKALSDTLITLRSDGPSCAFAAPVEQDTAPEIDLDD